MHQTLICLSIYHSAHWQISTVAMATENLIRAILISLHTDIICVYMYVCAYMYVSNSMYVRVCIERHYVYWNPLLQITKFCLRHEWVQKCRATRTDWLQWWWLLLSSVQATAISSPMTSGSVMGTIPHVSSDVEAQTQWSFARGSVMGARQQQKREQRNSNIM